MGKEKESAVEKDHCQCIEHQSRPDPLPRGMALGGAILCCSCLDGTFASVEEAAARIESGETVEPDPEIAEKYETQYRKFVQIYPTVKALFQTFLERV